MESRSLRLVCFSPTGTSRAVALAVARGLGSPVPEVVDITLPGGRDRRLETAAEELLIVAVPVYVGRVPELARGWLETVTAHGTPAVCIVVYGNREYDDALLELVDLVERRGGVPVAGAAFIGEHSFSSPETPIAVARPDAEDLRRAELFGRAVGETLCALEADGQAPALVVPGSRPYRERLPPPPAGCIGVGAGCVHCGACAGCCPVGGIDPDESSSFEGQCILCCACVKGCPEGARAVVEPGVRRIATHLRETCAARKEPEWFLPSIRGVGPVTG